MERQKEEARASWAGSGEAQTEAIWFKLRERLGATEFLGYGAEAAEGEVLALVAAGEAVEAAEAGDEVAIVVNQTPFYAESGGQVGDTGIDRQRQGRPLSPSATCRSAPTGSSSITARSRPARSRSATRCASSIDAPRRQQIRANHSATHLLHAALRSVLGSHVAQKGSLVAPDRLRFDFSHPKPLDAAEIESVEDARQRGRAPGRAGRRPG